MFSYWDKQHFLENHDVIIVGGGIAGLSCASSILETYPSKKVIILERGQIPCGASTKNAGFLLKQLVKKSNDILRKYFPEDVFIIKNEIVEECGFNKQNIKYIVQNRLCGQINVGDTIKALIQYVSTKGGLYLTGCEVMNYEQQGYEIVKVEVKCSIDNNQKYIFKTKNLILCTNGFTNNLIKENMDMIPLRGQIIMTKPIQNLKVKGLFCADYTSYYFRVFDNRILIGGGLLDAYEEEQTTEFKNSEAIKNRLLNYLKEQILPNTDFEVDFSWSGIMCFSKKNIECKDYIIQKIDRNVFFVGRFCGWGMCMASLAGQETKDLVFKNFGKL
ncbi:oxidoreductase, putative [Ichthyophthirius multifiliis]|uniref:Oxidoreductase, putative n=1 Tax=Ichthyophthirius multifiliis TaxID=5932 RepID=G0QYB7_ICHMU|nr:oxidoreductase, putative [Ichthyophthirius multifiliis]EGR29780.1 oxidoreductase, putative [Ichthyophthirius multifiliis]|eukprot:XP_004031016.1 oxidoreductase, putative [Ichthyophthirius multifiliis]